MIEISKIAGYKDNVLQIDLVKRRKDSPTIIFSSGFMTNDDKDWADFITAEFSEYQCIQAKWNSGSFRDVSNELLRGMGEALVSSVMFAALPTSTAIGFATRFGSILTKKATSSVTWLRQIEKGQRLWSNARRESELAGKHLAKALNAASIQRRSTALSRRSNVLLLGHSLGARLMVSCMEDVRGGIIDRAMFLGGAVDSRDHVFRDIPKKTKFESINMWSSNDDILRWLYRLGNLRVHSAIGRAKIDGRFSNIDATDWVSGHTGYCNNKVVSEHLHKALKMKRGLIRQKAK